MDIPIQIDITGPFTFAAFETPGQSYNQNGGSSVKVGDIVRTLNKATQNFTSPLAGEGPDLTMTLAVSLEWRPDASPAGYFIIVEIANEFFAGTFEDRLPTGRPDIGDFNATDGNGIVPIDPATDLVFESFGVATFTYEGCLCILNTLHCAGLTLAGFCGTDKHTAAIVLGTAGGRVTGGIKATAAQQNGLLGGWYSWH